MKLNGLSLFSSAGIAEFGFKKVHVDMKIASELLDIRSRVHEYWHPKSNVISGDITNDVIKKSVIDESLEKKINFIFATPPCQGMSLIGKNKTNDQMLNDARNFLIFHTFEIIDKINPDIVLIENVSRFFTMKFPYDNEILTIKEIIDIKYSGKYNLKFDIFDTADYGVPQSRKRAIVRMYKSNYTWNDPCKQNHITVENAIGMLPSLESGECSDIKNHNARTHVAHQIECMKHTPSGKSAFENEFYYPKNPKTGEILKGYSATYKRIDWNKPAPTITMRNDCISSQSNVHPGRLKEDGTYSDARVLSLRELFILSSLDPDLDVPSFASDSQIRYMIGEAVPPKLIEVLMKGLKLNEK